MGRSPPPVPPTQPTPQPREMVLFLCLLGSITALCSTPALIRHFLAPSPARPPRPWSYYAVWFITVLLIWLVAPVSWSFVLDLLLVQTLWQDRELGFAVWEWAALSWATIEVRLLSSVCIERHELTTLPTHLSCRTGPLVYLPLPPLSLYPTSPLRARNPRSLPQAHV